MENLNTNEESFLTISKYIYEITGMKLGKEKKYLIINRLMPLMEEFNIGDFQELYQKSRSNCSLEDKIIDNIFTHESFFFRDISCFELFRCHLVPQYLTRNAQKKSQTPLKILSAGCSTGQEAYSIAITLQEHFPHSEFQIVGYDISKGCILKAKKGEYTSLEIDRGLPPQLKSKYFKRNGKNWKIIDPIREKISFIRHNLMTPIRSKERFDIIFYRYVSAYLTEESRLLILKNLLHTMNENATVVLGVSEHPLGLKKNDEQQYPFYQSLSKTHVIN